MTHQQEQLEALIDSVADEAVSTAIAIDRGEVTLEDGQKHLKRMIDSGKHQATALIQEAEIKAVDKKLVTLQEVVPLLGLCEDDSNKILIWAKNHRWSLIAPKGEDTQAPVNSGGSNNE